MGKIHHKSVLKSLICEQPIIVDNDKKVVEKTSEFEFYKSLNEIPLEKISELDGAIISSPSNMHYEQANFFIDNKIPIMVEKPLTENLDTSIQLIKRAKDEGVPARSVTRSHRHRVLGAVQLPRDKF